MAIYKNDTCSIDFNHGLGTLLCALTISELELLGDLLADSERGDCDDLYAVINECLLAET